MPSISDVYAGNYVSASELRDGRRIPAVIKGATVEEVGHEQLKKVALTLVAPDGRPWPRRLVLNKTNAGILASTYGDDTTAWIGRAIEIWKEPTQFQGKIVPGIKLAAAAPPPLSGTAAIVAPAPAASDNGGIPAPSVGGGAIEDDDIPF